MIEEGIFDGDYVIIEQQDRADNGDIVVALVNNEEVTLKKIEQKSGQVILYPANSSMSAMIYRPDEVQIQGILTGLMRNYR
jgi:repressor LexA